MHPLSVTRRELMALAGTAGLVAPLAATAQQPAAAPGANDAPPEPFPANGNEALARLKAGNLRFVAGKTRHAHESADWRKHLVGEQRPIATVLGCSDSRVPPELVFDQGFGDLFVIRVAGNVVAREVVGSVMYAALHLRTPLFIVLGHASCGAVTAALQTRLKGAEEPESIAILLKLIDPAFRRIDTTLPFAAAVAAGIEANVRLSVEQLGDLPGAKAAIKEARITLVGGIYDLQTGAVNFLAQ